MLGSLTRRFTTSAFAGLAPRVEQFRHEEALDEPYLLEAVLHFDEPELDVTEMLGRDAALILERTPLERRVSGVVRTVRELAPGPGHAHAARVEVVPALWMLSLRRDTRVFQERSVPAILEAVLGEALAVYGRQVRLELDEGTYRPREYSLQYQESDLDFAHRLMEEEGISYSFDFEGDVELLVLRDRSTLAEPVPAESIPGAAPFRPADGEVREVEPVHRFERRHRHAATRISLRDYDWTLPTLVLEHARDGEDGIGRVRESYEHGEGRTVTITSYDAGARRYQVNDIERQTELRQQEHQARTLGALGVGRVTGFAPGRRFTLDGHPGVGVDDSYLITRVIHESRDFFEGHPGGASEPYHNTFECVPLATPHRPMRGRTRKPRIASMQTAIVTGPPGEEIHTDEWGRVKVRFHWDRVNPGNERSSAWVRVQQAWVGVGWGSLWIPRVGVEVVVQFVDGDPDRPVVTGCLYNGDNPPPYDLPAQKTKSTLKSNSTPGGGGFNEIRFEDAAGGEEMFIHSQKDHNRYTGNNESVNVVVDQSMQIGANQSTDVGANQSITVGANRRLDVGANHTIKVGANQLESIQGNSNFVVQGTHGHTVQGAETRLVNGAATETLNAGSTRTVNAGETETINGGSTRTVNGGEAETINGGLAQQITGDGAWNVTGQGSWNFGAKVSTVAGGPVGFFTPATFNITALGGFNMLCPAGGTVISPGGWTVIAPAGRTQTDSVTTSLRAASFSATGLSASATGISASLTGVSIAVTGASIGATGLRFGGTALENEAAATFVKTAAIKLATVGLFLRAAGLNVIA